MVNDEKISIIGTAGHVDHGKSALVRALTGTDPDRLAEEKSRGLTIDLGFAWLALPDGDVASFVDVPGHEDFLRNMLAGAGGVDACLMVIAADEGPMPQTLEHLAIVDLLGIRHGVVAVTKSDLADEEWLELVSEEVGEMIAGTTLADAPVVPVSAVSGDGLPALIKALERVVAAVPPAVDVGRPRLSVDRSFTLSGFGTVVTGTLRDGTLAPGDALVVLPAGHETRVRSLQSHGRSVERARPGTRTAINLAGIDTDAVVRGDTVVLPDDYRTTWLVDVTLRVLPGAPAPLGHDDEIHLFHGAAEIPCHARIIGQREIAPGQHGPAQLRLVRPTVAAAGDRFVIRRPSPPATIGGGVILDPHPQRRRRRFQPRTEARFAALVDGDPADVAWQMLAEREPARAEDLRADETGLEPEVRDAALTALADAGRARRMGALWITDRGWRTLRERAEAVLASHHRRHPLRRGAPSEELRQQLRLTGEAFAALVEEGLADDWLARAGEVLRVPGHEVHFSPQQQEAVDALRARFRAQPFTPPSARDAEALVGQSVLGALLERGDVVAVSGDVLFDQQAYETLRAAVSEHLEAHGQVTVADVRDRFATSRKYALALLEHLDRLRVTRREGDVHVRAAPAPSDQAQRDGPSAGTGGTGGTGKQGGEGT